MCMNHILQQRPLLEACNALPWDAQPALEDCGLDISKSWLLSLPRHRRPLLISPTPKFLLEAKHRSLVSLFIDPQTVSALTQARKPSGWAST